MDNENKSTEELVISLLRENRENEAKVLGFAQLGEARYNQIYLTEKGFFPVHARAVKQAQEDTEQVIEQAAQQQEQLAEDDLADTTTMK
jgi:hypothetical protein